MRKNKMFKRSQNKPASTSPTMKGPSLMGSVAHGMVGGFGAGVGIEGARAVIGGMSGSNSQDNVQKNQTVNKCVFEKEQLEKCMDNSLDCKDLIELLNNCYKAN
tara:strand:- start:194 stop:505 length:312 start_codon:yes stop_codon:yes gene_type:complete